MAHRSTNYYRANKQTGKILHRCPHCEFTTTYGKANLINHINAQHTCEKDKPFQCRFCEKGYAQKANLINHLKKVHDYDTSHLERKIIGVLYNISVTDNLPKTKKTKARREYYIKNKILKSTDINSKKHEYMDGTYLSISEIQYDVKKKFISVERSQLKEPIRIKCCCHIHVKIHKR
jgi:hypothetical protein